MGPPPWMQLMFLSSPKRTSNLWTVAENLLTFEITVSLSRKGEPYQLYFNVLLLNYWCSHHYAKLITLCKKSTSVCFIVNFWDFSLKALHAELECCFFEVVIQTAQLWFAVKVSMNLIGWYLKCFSCLSAYICGDWPVFLKTSYFSWRLPDAVLLSGASVCLCPQVSSP